MGAVALGILICVGMAHWGDQPSLFGIERNVPMANAYFSQAQAQSDVEIAPVEKREKPSAVDVAAIEARIQEACGAARGVVHQDAGKSSSLVIDNAAWLIETVRSNKSMQAAVVGRRSTDLTVSFGSGLGRVPAF